jgi:hypothetical protein
MILFICQKFLRCMIWIVILLIFLLVIATIMRGGYECPLYETNNYKLHLPTVDMHCYTLICRDSFIYKIPCTGRKLDFDITCWILCGVHYYALNC